MKIVRDVSEIRSALESHRKAEQSIGFVPTMGALHAGHLSLMRAARSTTDVAVLSIFVNPLQFGPNEDFSRYPRSEERDFELAEEEKMDVVFIPRVEDMYPTDAAATVTVGRLGEIVEGAARPGHFDGVATVVAKLFNLVDADVAFFGQKDAQQAAVIKRMVKDLSFRTRIQVEPIVREADGLALSSRNVYLSPEDRRQAPMLNQALREGAAVIMDRGSVADAERRVAEVATGAGFEMDYGSVVDPETFEPWAGGPALIVIAARLGVTRLIDNLQVIGR